MIDVKKILEELEFHKNELERIKKANHSLIIKHTLAIHDLEAILDHAQEIAHEVKEEMWNENVE